MIKKIFYKIGTWLFRPTMISGYRGSDGRYLANTRISNTTHIDTQQNLHIGDHVFIGHYNFLDASNGLTIEEGCQITNYISVLTHSSHISIRLYGSQYVHTQEKKGYIKGSVFIGKYSFIGPHSVIMPGSHIGKGSIVSAYSMVKDTFADFAIIAGNPAVVIGDTRKIDNELLATHPELQQYYNQWASN